jgi:2-amino-4-hydroxy-6-hydroxymethyldihydropteridine diphosphokinase
VPSTYLIALGSNKQYRSGNPRARLAGLELAGERARSRIIETHPLGPGTRSYANAVALVESLLPPPAMLAQLKAIERAHGRRAGRRWGDRPLDLDIIGWSGGIWASPGLAIPHPAFRTRAFVLTPLCDIAPDWRDPVTHLTARHLRARLDRKRPRA